MAGTLTKLAQAWKLGGIKSVPGGYPADSRSLTPWWYIPAGYVDLSRVGNGAGNSMVEACMNVLCSSFAEAPTAVYQPQDSQMVMMPGHPAEQLLARPNPHIVGELLWRWTLWALHLEGDAYWFKLRSAAGRVVQLWPLMPQQVEPRDGTGGLATAEEAAAHAQGQGAFIAYYEYRMEGRVARLEVADVVHLRLDVDPDNPRKGKGPIKSVLREVLADEEAGQFATALLRNMGIPGVVLTPDEPDDVGPDDDDADAIADSWEQRFGGANRGRPLVMTGGRWKVERVSFNPQEMDFKALRRIPEERVSAVTGVPAILAGLGAGLDRATYSNAGELREFFTEQKLAPLWRLLSAELSWQLMPEFSSNSLQVLKFDTTQVRALQDDQDKLFTRWLAALAQGGCTLAEFRQAVGLPTTPADDVYLRPANLIEVPVGETEASQLVRQAEAILAEQA